MRIDSRVFQRPDARDPVSKCKDCGWLAVRDERTRQVCEADPTVRDQGKHVSANGGASVARVFCWNDHRKFSEDEIGSQVSVVASIGAEIDCQISTPYRQGKTPGQVEEDKRIETIEARQSQLAEDAKAEKAKQRERDEKRDADNWARFWIGIGLTVALAVCNWLYSWATRATPGTASNPNANAPTE